LGRSSSAYPLRVKSVTHVSERSSIPYDYEMSTCILNRDVAGARQAMEEHIEFSLTVMRRIAAAENQE